MYMFLHSYHALLQTWHVEGLPHARNLFPVGGGWALVQDKAMEHTVYANPGAAVAARYNWGARSNE